MINHGTNGTKQVNQGARCKENNHTAHRQTNHDNNTVLLFKMKQQHKHTPCKAAGAPCKPISINTIHNGNHSTKMIPSIKQETRNHLANRGNHGRPCK